MPPLWITGNIGYMFAGKPRVGFAICREIITDARIPLKTVVLNSKTLLSPWQALTGFAATWIMRQLRRRAASSILLF